MCTSSFSTPISAKVMAYIKYTYGWKREIQKNRFNDVDHL